MMKNVGKAGVAAVVLLMPSFAIFGASEIGDQITDTRQAAEQAATRSSRIERVYQQSLIRNIEHLKELVRADADEKALRDETVRVLNSTVVLQRQRQGEEPRSTPRPLPTISPDTGPTRRTLCGLGVAPFIEVECGKNDPDPRKGWFYELLCSIGLGDELGADCRGVGPPIKPEER